MYRTLKGFVGKVPLRLIATVLVAILIPSLLVTALGLIAAFEADRYVKEYAKEPFQRKLRQLSAHVGREWSRRLDLYSRLIAQAREPGDLLASLRDDPYILEVLLTGPEGLRPLPITEPVRELWFDGRHQGLIEARQQESSGLDPAAALEQYLEILDGDADDAARLEALLGASRIHHGFRRRKEALEYLDQAIDRYGSTVDETGVLRSLPLLLRRLDLLDAADVVGRSATSRMLLALLEQESSRMDPATVRFFRREVEKRTARPGAPAAGGSASAPSRGLSAEQLRRLGEPLETAAANARFSGECQYTRAVVPGAGETVFATHAMSDRTMYVHLRLHRARFLEDARLFLDDLEIAESSLKLVSTLPSEDGDLSPDRVRSKAVAWMRMPAPFDHLQWCYLPEPGSLPPGFRSFDVFTLTTFSWAIVVLVITILAGTLLTLRSVFLEMRTARMKSDFVSFISHELKTPLAAIRMFTETLLAGRVESDEEREECLKMIDQESDRLANLIDRVLAYSKIQQQKKVFQYTGCSMEDVVKEAVRLFTDYNKERPREIEVNSVQHISKIKMDRASMIELMLNLISNAAKYSPKDKKIVINLRESIDEITVEVIDRGLGIRKRDQRRVFEQFYRADDYLTRDVEGYGLGLAFARYIAREHNGDIRVSSQLHSGSTFTLTLRKTDVLAG